MSLHADLIAALKAAPNYGARAGQAIAGALGRGGDGKFTRVGNSLPVNPNRRPKVKKGRAGAKPKLSDAEQSAGLEKAGVKDAAALLAFSQGGTMDSATTARLATAGLVEIGSDGNPRLAPNARGLLAAARRGDERGIKDALSKTTDRNSRNNDREIKRQQRDAERAARSAERERKKGERQAAQAERAKARAAKSESAARASAARAEARAASRAKAMDKRIGNQTEEINARLDDRGGELSAAETTRAVNRLEDAADALDSLALPDARKAELKTAIEKTLARLNGGPEDAKSPRASSDARIKEMPGVFSVKQDGAGVWRWLVVSSNAFQDRENEIVSLAALERDAARMDETKEYGPLRWWHVGDIEYARPLDWTSAKAGPGLDIGDCDFVAVHGRMLVEGGTFRNKQFAERAAALAPTLQVSRGFTHPFTEPAGGVYSNIKGIERSLLPAGRAANALTAVAVTRGKDMATLKEKWSEFVAGMFAGDETAARDFAASVSQTEKAADDSGLTFKEDGPIEPAAPADPTAEQKAGGDGGDAGGDGGDTPFVGDMTIEELVSALAPALASAMAKGMEPVQAELDAAKEQLAATQKELQALGGRAEKEAGDVAALAGRVQALEGDAPRAPFVPSKDTPAKSKEDKGIQTPAPKNDLDKVVDLMFAHTTGN